MAYQQLLAELLRHYSGVFRLSQALGSNTTSIRAWMDGTVTPCPQTVAKINHLAIRLRLIK